MPIDIIQNIEKGVLPNTATTQLFLMDVEKFLDALPMQPIFDLVVTSPPKNMRIRCHFLIITIGRKESLKRYILGSKITEASAGKWETMLRTAVLRHSILSLPLFLKS